MTVRTTDADCTRGPAKWAAVVVLGSAMAALGLKSPMPVAAAPRHQVDLNRAGATELELLPRIGPALAERIVADRAARGEFADLADLERVQGVGPKTIDGMRGWVRQR